MSGKSSIDNELERLLAGEATELEALYRRLPAAEPDAKLDAAVLAMAHRAVNPHLAAAPPQSRRTAQRPRPWMFALGSAAGVVFAAGIAWHLRSTIEQNGAESVLPSSAPAMDGRIDVKTLPQAQEKTAPAVTDAATAPTAAPAMAPAPPPAMPIASAPAPATTRAAKPMAAPPMEAAGNATPMKEERGRARDEQGVTEYTTSGGPAGTAPKPSPFPADAQSDKQEKLDTVVVSGSRIKRVDLETASPAIEVPRSAVSDAVDRKAALASGADHAAPPAPEPEARRAADATLRDVPTGGAPRQSATLQNNARLAPQKWIGVMQQLLRDGNEAEARENLDLFRRKYPRQTLPPELRALLPAP